MAGLQVPILTMNISSDHEWLDWVEVQKKVLKLEVGGQIEEAIREISAFVALERPTDVHCDALRFRAILEEEQGEFEAAREDRHKARSLAPSGSYSRYTIELGLAGLHEKMGEVEKAAAWYTTALETVILDPLTSGATAVEGLLEIRDRSSWEDHVVRLVERVIRQAWELFSLPGEPDLVNLRETLQILSDASTRPLPRTSGPQSA